MANTASVVSQRHTNSPVTPPADHSGQISARKSHAELASGAPYVGQLHSWRVGTAWVDQITLPTSRWCQRSVSWSRKVTETSTQTAVTAIASSIAGWPAATGGAAAMPPRD